MTQAHIDLRSQLDSQNVSNISDPSTTPLCNTSPLFFLSPIEPANTSVEQMDTKNIVAKSSDTDNDAPSKNKKPSEPSASTHPPSKKI